MPARVSRGIGESCLLGWMKLLGHVSRCIRDQEDRGGGGDRGVGNKGGIDNSYIALFVTPLSLRSTNGTAQKGQTRII